MGHKGNVKTSVWFPVMCGAFRLFLGSVAKKKKTKICRQLHVSLSVSMEKLDFHLTDFHNIWYWGLLLKCLHIYEFWLKPEDNRRKDKDEEREREREMESEREALRLL